MKLHLFLPLLTLLSLPLHIMAESQRHYVVGFAQDNMSNDWRAAQVNEMKQALEKYPFIRFVHTDAEGSAARQVLDMQRLVEQGVDVIVTSPRDVKIMTPAISAIYRKGIPVVLLTRRILSDDYTTFIGADDRQIARNAAEEMVTRLGGKGRIVMLQGVPTATTAIQRKKGFAEVIKAHPDINIVAEPVANYSRVDAIRAVEQLIAEGVEFDAIYAHSDSMAVGARMAMKMAGIDPKNIIIIGIDYIDEARAAIRAGEQSVSFTYPTAGGEGAAAVLKIIQGKTATKDQAIPFARVTSDNVEQVETVFE
ncbi:MAG: substrate-binding domain-containing protein [Pseudomonadota bacterium]